jgi:hypothetical protein
LCPECCEEIWHTTEKYCKIAEKKGVLCKKCARKTAKKPEKVAKQIIHCERNCPSCKSIINYTDIDLRNFHEEKQTLCNTCIEKRKELPKNNNGPKYKPYGIKKRNKMYHV